MALKLRVNEVAERPMVAADADVAVSHLWPTMARTQWLGTWLAPSQQPAVRTLCFIFIFNLLCLASE